VSQHAAKGGKDITCPVFKPVPHTVLKGKGGKEEWVAHLKITRRGELLRAYFSGDGKRWTRAYGVNGGEDVVRPGKDENAFPGELRVGVAVAALTERAVEVTFDQFKLTPVKAARKKD
jgi:hypothetical protein